MKRLTLLCLSMLGAMLLPVQGQIDEVHQRSATLMQQGKWPDALAELAACTDQYGKKALELFGPRFGWFWYHRGYCELKTQDFAAARTSFEACYTLFPNNVGAQAGNDNAQTENYYHKLALLKWGEACMQDKDYEKALELFKKFLKERDKQRDRFNPGVLAVQQAICNFRLGKVSKGMQHFETAIKNKAKYRLTDDMIMAAFQTMGEAVVNEKKEKALVDFISKNRALLEVEPFQRQKMVPIFLKLASDGLQADPQMREAAFALYTLFPGTKDAIDDAKAVVAPIVTAKKTFKDGSKNISKDVIKKSIETLRAQESTGDPYDAYGLLATAVLYEQKGNARGAYAAYKRLERLFSGSSRRETNLYNLVRTSSVIGEIFDTEIYGRRYLEIFPGGKYEEQVRNLLLTSLFYEGEYEKCITIAGNMIDSLTVPSEPHDTCLYVLAGSYYYTYEVKAAQPLLDKHVETYPESKFKIPASYFQASNKTRQQFWKAAGKLLDKFLEAYPDPDKNIYLSFALFDRANVHYALEENDPALSKINRIESEFPDSEVIELAYNLKGNILQSTNKFDEAETYYLKALAGAESDGNEALAGESLYYLVGLLAPAKRGKENNSRMADSLPFYDKYWDKYATDSPYQAQVAVAGMDALIANGRKEEALSRLQEVIAEMASDPTAFGLEEAINSYKNAYLTDHSPEELKEHFDAFPVASEDRAALALLRIAVIGVFEDLATQKSKNPEDEAKIAQARARVKVLFQELQNEFDLKDLSNFILVKLGDYLRERTSTPRSGLPFYEEAISREDLSYRFAALFGKADILAKAPGADDKRKAIKTFVRIQADSQVRSEQEKALFGIIETSAALNDWKTVKERSSEYLQNKAQTKFRPEASFYLAQAYDNIGLREDALASYGRVQAAYTGMIRFSAPATVRIVEITRKRGRPASGAGTLDSDVQVAYNNGARYIKSTQSFFDRMTDEDQKAWKKVENLVTQVENDPQVVSLEEQANQN